MADTALKPWSVDAINLPEHGDNPIHTDAGARAAGFEAAIVAGTTIYAYMTRPPVAAWGERWLTEGGGELSLLLPVLDQDHVECAIDTGEETVVSAQTQGKTCARLEVWEKSDPPPLRTGDKLGTMNLMLSADQASYGQRCGDDLAIYSELDVAHPSLWPCLANQVFIEHLVTGPWIHTRSKIYHQALVRAGAQMTIDSTLVERFETRSGERALVDINITVDGSPVVQIEHEALIRLTD